MSLGALQYHQFHAPFSFGPSLASTAHPATLLSSLTTSSPYILKRDLYTASKEKTRSKMKRAASIPLLDRTTTHDPGKQQSPTDSDKPRNKLGYQRISIACSHCRRRKIRCAVAEGDPQGRCSNCIRLKKDCHFYPVDVSSGESRIHPKASTSSKPSSVMSTSPSTQAADRHDDSDREMNTLRHVPSTTSSASLHLEKPDALGLSAPLSSAPTHSIYPAPIPMRSEWGHSSYAAPHSGFAPDPQAQSHWRYQEAPTTDSFSPFASHHHHHQQQQPQVMHESIAYPHYMPAPREEHGYHQQSMRSASYGQIERGPHQGVSQYTGVLPSPRSSMPDVHYHASASYAQASGMPQPPYAQVVPSQHGRPLSHAPGSQQWGMYEQNQYLSTRHDSSIEGPWMQHAGGQQLPGAVLQSQQRHANQYPPATREGQQKDG